MTRASPLLLSAAALTAACGSSPPSRPEPVSIVRPRRMSSESEDSALPAVEDWDRWGWELGEFMSREELREHLEAPAGERLARRANRLMDLTLRKELLRDARARLEARGQRLPGEVVEAVRAADSYDAARRALERALSDAPPRAPPEDD